MDEKKLREAIEQLKKEEKKKFKQSVDLIINFKGIDLKKPEHNLNYYQPLAKPRSNKIKICALVGPESYEDAKANCDMAILQEEFAKYQENPKLAKKLAGSYDYFIAQANIMAKLATVFGKAFGPRGKMPDPKAGAVFPPKASLKPIVERLQKTVRIRTKNEPCVKALVGTEDDSTDDMVSNIKVIYDSIIPHLPAEKQNIKSVLVKLTMGKPIKVE